MTTDTRRAVANEFNSYTTNWVQAAICLYEFDRETAQRLAFIRWLRATGRLRGDDSPLLESASMRGWMSG